MRFPGFPLIAVAAAAALLVAGCGAGPSPAAATSVAVAPQPSSTSATPTPARDDLGAMWTRWHGLNDTCRGGPPRGEDATVDRACADRDALTERAINLAMTEFLAAWRARDESRMRELSAVDATDTFGRPIVESLREFRPAEGAFERTEVAATGIGAYISTSQGPDLFFEWDLDYARGPIVQSFAPDVG